MCIPWRNYQSLTDCLIDKSHFENISRQISKVMDCLTVYVSCHRFCFQFNRNYFTHLVWPNFEILPQVILNFFSLSFKNSYCILYFVHVRRSYLMHLYWVHMHNFTCFQIVCMCIRQRLLQLTTYDQIRNMLVFFYQLQTDKDTVWNGLE